MWKVLHLVLCLLVVLPIGFITPASLQQWQQLRVKNLAAQRESLTSFFDQDTSYHFVRPQVNPFPSRKELESALERDPFGNFSPQDYVVQISDIAHRQSKTSSGLSNPTGELNTEHLNTRVIKKKEKKIISVAPSKNMDVQETDVHQVEIDYDVELMPGLQCSSSLQTGIVINIELTLLIVLWWMK